jgi:hypothetical protein
VAEPDKMTKGYGSSLGTWFGYESRLGTAQERTGNKSGSGMDREPRGHL